MNLYLSKLELIAKYTNQNVFYASMLISVSDCISTISSPPSRRTSRTGEIRPPNQRTRSVTPQRLIQELSKNFQQEKMGDRPDEGKEIPIGRPIVVYDRSSGKRRLLNLLT